MGKHKKLILDLVFGAVIPLLLLTKYTTEHLGARPAYVLAGLIPAIYIVWDVCFYTKRFNAITTLVAINAVTQGGLAFLKVDGWKYAAQDAVGTTIMFLVFAGTLVIGRPVLNYFLIQVLEPENPEEERLGWTMLRQPEIHRTLVLGTGVLLLEHAMRGGLAFYLNLTRVTAKFGTPEFNAQKLSVESMTRFVFMGSAIGSMFVAYMLVSNSIDKWIGDAGNDGGTIFEQIAKRLGLAAPKAPVKEPEPVGSAA